MLTFPNIDPVIFSVGPIAVRWYSLAYVFGVVLGWLYISRIDERYSRPARLMTKEQLSDVIIWAIIGIILGGRAGYILFYNLPYYLNNPYEILRIWHGGMSFHGGLLGVIISFYIFSRRNRISFIPLMDRIACAAPIGLFFGRIANFINGELYGRVTDASIGMVFPRGGAFPRHPSQLYEAALEGLLLFAILYVVVSKFNALSRKGLCCGIFLAGYGISRFIVEYFREPDSHIGFVFMQLSMGQLLSVPMVMLGIYFVIFAYNRKRR